MGDAVDTFDTFGLVGTVLAEKYAIESVVDVGGTAIVYRAQHRLWNHAVAVKVFVTPEGVTPEARAAWTTRFVREGQLLAQLSERTSAVVQARDVGTFTTKRGLVVPYMVLEWLEGETLERVLEAEAAAGLRARPLAEAMRLLDPVAHALGLAHRMNITHRDLKPSNIFVIGAPRDPAATTKVLDFGVAKVDGLDAVTVPGATFTTGENPTTTHWTPAHAADPPSGANTTTKMTVHSLTPAYGAPEQFSPALGPTGPWTDVFGLALVLCELVTGRAPLEGDTIANMRRASLDPSRRPSLSRGGPPRSPGVEAAFGKAVAVAPRERYATVDAFWLELRRAADEESTAGSRETLETMPETNTTTNEPGNRRTAQMLAGFLAGGLVLGAVAIAVGTSLVRAPRSAASTEALTSALSPSAATAPVTATAVSPAASAPSSRCPDDMVFVPAGAFLMGSDEPDAEKDERPAHRVGMNAFCIDRTEVTIESLVSCATQGTCGRVAEKNEWNGITRDEHATYDPLCNGSDSTRRAKHPANCIGWSDARDYCAAHGRRLPTEAEWEYAARGADGRRYPWGDAEPTSARLNACGAECLAWGAKAKRGGVGLDALYTDDDGWPATAPVGSFPLGASPFGALDMTGNVWEWVADVYGSYAKADGASPSHAASENAGVDHVVRGGAWNGGHGSWVRPTYRFHAPPSMRSHGIGFRCAMPLP